MSVTITCDEWRAAFEAAVGLAGKGDEGATIWEICAQTGLAHQTVKVKLAALGREGRVVCGRSPRAGIDGVMRRIPVYRIKPVARLHGRGK